MSESESESVSVSVSVLELASSYTPRLTRAEGSRQPGGAQNDQGIGVVSFLTALGSGSALFILQFLLFLTLRNHLSRIL